MSKRWRHINLAILATLITTAAFAPPGIIGNPGDLRILMFKKARNEAVNMIGKLALYRELFEGSIELPGPLNHFFLKEGVLEALQLDILQSPHWYDSETRAQCAWTNDPDPGVKPPGLNTIRLSLPACAPFLSEGGQSRAVHILIHESVHHLLRADEFRRKLGIQFASDPTLRFEQEEAFCDEVADKVSQAFEKVAQAGVPHWADISMRHNLEDRGFHTAFWTGNTNDPNTSNRMLVWGGCREGDLTIYGCSKYFNDGAIFDPSVIEGSSPTSSQWEAMSTENAPEARSEQAAAFSDFAEDPDQLYKMFVWGGCTDGDGCVRDLNSGGIYDVKARSWEKVNPQGAPSPRSNHSVVWTGKEFLVWGGAFGAHTPNVNATALSDGGAYDPATRKWRPIASSENITSSESIKFSARSFHSAIWTGETGNAKTANRMLVWGGCDFEEYLYCKVYYGDGALYDPSTNTWEALTTFGPAPTPRRLHGGIYIKEHHSFLVWGGQRTSRTLNDGAYLNLRTLRWSAMRQPAPERRSRHTMVWTGDHVIVFGGEVSENVYAEDIGVFTFPPSGVGTGRWESLNRETLPIKVINHTAVWTPGGMLVWGGQTDRRAFANIGGLFSPGDLDSP